MKLIGEGCYQRGQTCLIIYNSSLWPFFCIFFALLILSAHVERFGMSGMRDLSSLFNDEPRVQHLYVYILNQKKIMITALLDFFFVYKLSRLFNHITNTT